MKIVECNGTTTDNITLKRNYGYQNSLFCGLENAKGDLITMIDCDLQDPPEMLNDFIKYSNLASTSIWTFG